MKTEKTLQELIHDMMQEKAVIMCEKYCKYGDAVKEEGERIDNDMSLWQKVCMECPMNEFYAD